MVQFLNRTNLSPVRKRWYHTQTEPKPVSSQKKMVQYSNIAKTCHKSKKIVQYNTQNTSKTSQQSEKDGIILKQRNTCHQSEKDGTILKQSRNPSPVRKRWYNTQTVPKPVNSQKKLVQFSNSAKTS